MPRRNSQLLRPNLPQTLWHPPAASVPVLAAKAPVRLPRSFQAAREIRRKEIDETWAKYSIRSLPFRLTRVARENYKQRLCTTPIKRLRYQEEFNVHAA